MVSLIIFIVVLALIYWAVSLIPLPEPFGQIVKVVFIIIAVVAIINALGFHTGLTLK